MGLAERRMLLLQVSWQYWHGRILAHSYLVLQGVSHNLGYLIFLASQPCPIWTIAWGIHSNLEGPFLFWCLRSFWRSLRSDMRIISIASAWAGVSTPSNIFWDLRSCLQVFECIATSLSVLLSEDSQSFQSFPWFLEFYEVLVRTAPRLRAPPQEVLFLNSVIFVSRRRRFQRAVTLLSNRLSIVAVFTNSLWGGEDKNRGNIIIG